MFDCNGDSIYNSEIDYGRNDVSVSAHAFDRAVKHLSRIEALALIRASYHESDGGYATLEHAKEIYEIICK